MLYFPRYSEQGDYYYRKVLLDFAIKHIQEKINFLEGIKSNLKELF